jgi:hypothetical protein
VCVFEVEMVDDGAPNSEYWQYQTEKEGYSGKGYFHWEAQESIEYKGGGTTEPCRRFDPIDQDCYLGPEEGILKFYFKIENGGEYYIWLRNSHPGHEGNDVWLAVDGSQFVKEFDGDDTDEWTYSDRNTEDWVGPRNLSSGEHTLIIAGRQGLPDEGYRLDQIVIAKSSISQSNLPGPDAEISEYEGSAPLYPHDDLTSVLSPQNAGIAQRRDASQVDGNIGLYGIDGRLIWTGNYVNAQGSIRQNPGLTIMSAPSGRQSSIATPIR